MTTASQEVQAFGVALRAHGWRPLRAGVWSLETPHGPAVLKQLRAGGDWLQFAVQGGLVPVISADRICAENFGLYGPLKFVTSSSGRASCRADVPKEFSQFGQRGHRGYDVAALEDIGAGDARRCWAAAVTAAMTGDFVGLAAPPPPDKALVEHLNEAGWPASFDDDRLQVHLHLPGLFRSVCMVPQEPPGMKVCAELLPLDGVGGHWWKAAMRLARAANDRLPLVRLALSGETRSRALWAEVHVGCAPIPSGWLPTALEVVEAAVSLTARELQALRDRELAELVLASAAGPSS